jgi:hypothetical protein
MTIFVQFNNPQQEKIISVFSCPQDLDKWDNQGEVEDTDVRFVAYKQELLSVFGVVFK